MMLTSRRPQRREKDLSLLTYTLPYKVCILYARLGRARCAGGLVVEVVQQLRSVHVRTNLRVLGHGDVNRGVETLHTC